jgi:hypothetical protein
VRLLDPALVVLQPDEIARVTLDEDRGDLLPLLRHADDAPYFRQFSLIHDAPGHYTISAGKDNEKKARASAAKHKKGE